MSFRESVLIPKSYLAMINHKPRPPKQKLVTRIKRKKIKPKKDTPLDKFKKKRRERLFKRYQVDSLGEHTTKEKIIPKIDNTKDEGDINSILKYFPGDVRYKVFGLLKFLRDNTPLTLNWDSKTKAIILKEVKMLGTNIVDILRFFHGVGSNYKTELDQQHIVRIKGEKGNFYIGIPNGAEEFLKLLEDKHPDAESYFMFDPFRVNVLRDYLSRAKRSDSEDSFVSATESMPESFVSATESVPESFVSATESVPESFVSASESPPQSFVSATESPPQSFESATDELPKQKATLATPIVAKSRGKVKLPVVRKTLYGRIENISAKKKKHDKVYQAVKKSVRRVLKFGDEPKTKAALNTPIAPPPPTPDTLFPNIQKPSPAKNTGPIDTAVEAVTQQLRRSSRQRKPVIRMGSVEELQHLKDVVSKMRSLNKRKRKRGDHLSPDEARIYREAEEASAKPKPKKRTKRKQQK